MLSNSESVGLVGVFFGHSFTVLHKLAATPLELMVGVPRPLISEVDVEILVGRRHNDQLRLVVEEQGGVQRRQLRWAEVLDHFHEGDRTGGRLAHHQIEHLLAGLEDIPAVHLHFQWTLSSVLQRILEELRLHVVRCLLNNQSAIDVDAHKLRKVSSSGYPPQELTLRTAEVEDSVHLVLL